MIGLHFSAHKSADFSGAGTRDQPLRTSALEASINTVQNNKKTANRIEITQKFLNTANRLFRKIVMPQPKIKIPAKPHQKYRRKPHHRKAQRPSQ